MSDHRKGTVSLLVLILRYRIANYSLEGRGRRHEGSFCYCGQREKAKGNHVGCVKRWIDYADAICYPSHHCRCYSLVPLKFPFLKFPSWLSFRCDDVTALHLTASTSNDMAQMVENWVDIEDCPEIMTMCVMGCVNDGLC